MTKAVDVRRNLEVLSEAEARELTDRIRTASESLYTLLLEAYEREAWRVLGHASWGEYVHVEFSIGRQYSYRLLDQGRVIKAIESAASHARTGKDLSPVGDTITERDARELKPRLEEVTSEIRDRVEAGEPAAEVVNDVIRKARKPEAGSAAGAAQELPTAHGAGEGASEGKAAPARGTESEDEYMRERRRQLAERAREAAAEMNLRDTIANLRAQLQQRDAVLNRVRRVLGLPKEGDIVAAVEALVERAA